MNLKEYIEELKAQLKEIKSKPWFPGQGNRVEVLEISLNIAKDWNPRIYDALAAYD